MRIIDGSSDVLTSYLKACRHARLFLPRALPARHGAGAIEAVALLFEALPALHEPIGAQVRIGQHARLLGHRLDHRAAAARRRLAQQGGNALHRRCEVTRGSRPDLRSEEKTYEIKSRMRNSYAGFSQEKKKNKKED